VLGPEASAAVVETHAAGSSLVEVAERLGVGLRGVRRALRALVSVCVEPGRRGGEAMTGARA
jgi:hypothetical protein